MSKPTVSVIGNDNLVTSMFRREGWDSVMPTPDLICFTGGEDVSPELYGETKHYTTYSNSVRDGFESKIFNYARKHNIPMVGICRGGQFLNVMCGGKMWQDVDCHAIRGTHTASRLDTDNPTIVNVTSTHHQMMRPTEEAILLLQSNDVHEVRSPGKSNLQLGVEAVLYPEEKCLCFQPHPEYGAISAETKELFFEYINKYFNLRGE